MKHHQLKSLAGASLLALAAAASAAAQDQPSAPASAQTSTASEVDVVVVTARRRDESIQDVPAVVNAVTPEELVKLNIRDFTEVQNLVPGLSLTNNANGIGGSAQIRGVNFEVNASGNNATVEFYQNDAPITAGLVLQQMYDVGQIEVLRGPQGTLRGRASPSGSITVTTKKPDLYQSGGYGSFTATDTGTTNFNGAVNIPIIEGIAAIRIAGVMNGDEANRVHPISTVLDSRDPETKSQGARITALVRPIDALSLEGSYQEITTHSRFFDQVESFNQANPSAPASPVTIRAKDRLSNRETPRENRQHFNIYNARAEYGFGGQQLIYQFQRYTQHIESRANQDWANALPNFDFYQFNDTHSTSTSHELRLQNEERIFDRFDYVLGLFDDKNVPPSDLIVQTPVTLPAFLGGGVQAVAVTPINRIGKTHEQSAFGNLTFHLDEDTELSGGARYIQYDSTSALIVSGARFDDPPTDVNKVIYSLSAKHSFSRDFMIYATTGTSFRPGVDVVGNFSVVKSPLENSFIHLPPETSQSYEAGFKSTLLGGKARVNISAFHQTFENYPYRAPGNGIYYVNYAATVTGGVVTVTPQVSNFNFVAAVPVKVNGVEAELNYSPVNRLNLNLVSSYALGKIKNATIPCNDLNNDGIPDATTAAPSLAQLQAAVGADLVGSCTVSQRSAAQAPFSSTLQADYTVPVSGKVEGYVRGMVAYYGKSQGDPGNSYDDVDAYGLVNLFGGLRAASGAWELSLYAKNVFDTTKVLTRTDPLSSSYQVLQPPTFRTTAATTVTSSYTDITTTQPREFGVSLRVAIGSR